MKQENYLYKILSIDCFQHDTNAGALKAVAEVEFLPDCPVYRGHFPGLPITPGVLLLTVAREIVERAIRISGALNINVNGVDKGFQNPPAQKAGVPCTNSAGNTDDIYKDNCFVTELIKNVKFLQVLTPDSGPVKFVINELKIEREPERSIEPADSSNPLNETEYCKRAEYDKGSGICTTGGNGSKVTAKISIVGNNKSSAGQNPEHNNVEDPQNGSRQDSGSADTVFSNMTVIYRMSAD